jgi:hypothetical protein
MKSGQGWLTTNFEFVMSSVWQISQWKIDLKIWILGLKLLEVCELAKIAQRQGTIS